MRDLSFEDQFYTAYNAIKSFADSPQERIFATYEAIYWWSNLHHAGQFSESYKALCISMKVFKPGPNESGPEFDSLARIAYTNVCFVAGCGKECFTGEL